MGSIHAENLGKYYKRYSNRWSRLAEWLDPDGVERHDKHWVLRDVSFDIRSGESVGIIGHNGAGKSTLLKLITGTTQSSTGRAQVQGRVAALLELGMGFHPDFTGRQNTYMAGQLLGYSNEEVAARMAEIEAFAEIGDYIDQPVRTYSSGMQVRLAFSVATAIRPDILIVDEALSVGDVFFQQKCFERIRHFKEQGTTLLFVTHSLSTVYSLCDRAILLDHGNLLRDADPKSVIDLYQRHELEQINKSSGASQAQVVVETPPAEVFVNNDAGGTGSKDTSVAPQEVAGGPSESEDFVTGLADIESVTVECDGKPVSVVISDSEIAISVVATTRVDLEDPHVGFQIRDVRGEPIFMTHTYAMNQRLGPLAAGCSVKVTFLMKLPLAPGDYTITAGVANGGYGERALRQMLARRQSAAKLAVSENRLGMAWAGVCNLHPSVKILEPHDKNPPVDATGRMAG